MFWLTIKWKLLHTFCHFEWKNFKFISVCQVEDISNPWLWAWKIERLVHNCIILSKNRFKYLQIVLINPLNQIQNFKCVQNIHILDKMGLAKQWSAFCLWRKVFIAFEKSSWLFIVLSLCSKYLFEMWWVPNLA